MAQLSLGEAKWRMLRMAVLHGPTFKFLDVRSWTRQDRTNFDWLLARKFIELASGENYRLTPLGSAAAELGMYDLVAPEPPKKPAKATAKKK